MMTTSNCTTVEMKLCRTIKLETCLLRHLLEEHARFKATVAVMSKVRPTSDNLSARKSNETAATSTSERRALAVAQTRLNWHEQRIASCAGELLSLIEDSSRAPSFNRCGELQFEILVASQLLRWVDDYGRIKLIIDRIQQSNALLEGAMSLLCDLPADTRTQLVNSCQRQSYQFSPAHHLRLNRLLTTDGQMIDPVRQAILRANLKLRSKEEIGRLRDWASRERSLSRQGRACH